MKNNRVLIINTNPTCYDGIMSAIFNYIENMDRADMAIDYVSINKVEESICKRLEQTGVRIYVLPFRIKRPLKYIYQLSSIIKKGTYSIIHIHGSSCIMAVEMLAGKLAGVPAYPHSHSTNCEHKKIHRILRPVFHLLYKNGFACSEEAGHWLYGDRQFEVINNGINLEQFQFDSTKRGEFRKRLKLSANDIGIVHIAHFTQVKNHAFLIEVFNDAMKKCQDSGKNFKLFLLGQGKTQKDTKKLVMNYGLQDKVFFVGVTQEVPMYLMACDLMVLPSHYEGFPFVVLEAQATGLRCLVSDTVTKKCHFSDELWYLPLEKERWVMAILNSDNNYNRYDLCNKNQEKIKNSGYDIKAVAILLKKFYMQYGK